MLGEPQVQSDLNFVDTTIEQPVDSQQTVSLEDRRRSERVDQQIPGWISGESNDRSARGRNVRVQNLSMHGVGFLDATQRYRIGAAHWLVVNGGAMRLSTRVKIVSCREAAEGGFIIGAAFF